MSETLHDLGDRLGRLESECRAQRIAIRDLNAAVAEFREELDRLRRNIVAERNNAWRPSQ